MKSKFLITSVLALAFFLGGSFATAETDADVASTGTVSVTDANLVTTTSIKPVSSVAALEFKQTLRRGAKNDYVLALQEKLKAMGFYDRDLDADYGSGTENAVRLFQQAYGLKVDGIAGPNTFAKILAWADGSGTTLPPVVDSGDNTICPALYEPVCGQKTINCVTTPCDQPAPQTFSNKCVMTAAGASYKYSGVCTDTKPVEKDDLGDEEIKALIEKLEKEVLRLENYIKEIKEKIERLEGLL